ncbi:hypothetical protein PV721_04840 [Streptomyces sp. MB09-01]|uniref:hypothetical protein n=1 Tax=Streptomyces sp. MB09-01 TaxID=3028666 RepID=UPI0029BC60D3|nr:hypothetical protein [Streptomyces sp. MB09-01]MDX3533701.1 hypothetical protein [Streptomyces sp. MB09-01]
MSFLDTRHRMESVMVIAAALAGLSVAAAQPAAAAVDGATGQSCSWACGKLTNSTNAGLWATVEWGTSDSERFYWKRWVPAGTSMGGNSSGVDVDGVYVAGGCVASGYVAGILSRPVWWSGGWHKISGDEHVVLSGLSC